MANLSEDIQCAGFDTWPPMLDRTDFASWQQHIRLYCRGKENRVNILKSIDEGPFKIGMFRETIVEGEEGAFHLGTEQARVYSDLSPEDKERYNADIQAISYFKEDIQCAGFDTWPPMLDRTDFASWQQHIRLYCRGKENRVNILKSIDEGPFKIGMFRETIVEGDEGAFHLGTEQDRVYSDLSPEDKERYNADIQAISYFKGYQKTSTLSSIITLMQNTFRIM
nr:integrase, catalytic region, zinc finger, CCHC-type, peptidase aspartic, catalytic [Tanacetum cinerariifolium]